MLILERKPLMGATLEQGRPPRVSGAGPIISLGGSDATGARSSIGISDDILAKGVLLLGSAGCGKTTVLGDLLRQTIDSVRDDDVIVVFDPKGDFGGFARQGDIRFGTDVGCTGWNIFLDVLVDGESSEAIGGNAREIAEAVFADNIAKSNQEFFPESAAIVFAAVLKAMAIQGIRDPAFRGRRMNNAGLKRYLDGMTAEGLARFVDEVGIGKEIHRYLGGGSNDQALGIQAELDRVVGVLFAGSFGKDGGISMREAVRGGSARRIFVEYDPSRPSLGAYQALLDLALKERLGRKGASGRMILFLDELRMLPHLAYLENGLTFGREKGVRIVAACQSAQQIYESYGREGGDNLLAAFQTLALFSTTDSQAVSHLQGRCGRNVVSISYLDDTNRFHNEVREGNVVEDWDVADLAVGQAIVCQPMLSPYRFAFDEYDWRC